MRIPAAACGLLSWLPVVSVLHAEIEIEQQEGSVVVTADGEPFATLPRQKRHQAGRVAG